MNSNESKEKQSSSTNQESEENLYLFRYNSVIATN